MIGRNAEKSLQVYSTANHSLATSGLSALLCHPENLCRKGTAKSTWTGVYIFYFL